MATQAAEAAPAPEGLLANDALTADNDADQAGEQERDYEAEARAAGWKPLEEFGDDEKRPARPKDAQTFVEEGERLASLQAPQIRALKQKVGALETQIKRLGKAEQMAYANAMADLKRQQEMAVESGDIAAHREIDKQLDTLRENVAGQSPSQADLEASFRTFRKDHMWFDRGALPSATQDEANARLRFIQIADDYGAQGLDKTMDPDAFLAKIVDEVKEEFPSLGNGRPARTKPAPDVAGVTRTAANRNAKVGANLPAEAKEHARRYMRMGIYKNCKNEGEAFDRFAKDYTGPW